MKRFALGTPLVFLVWLVFPAHAGKATRTLDIYWIDSEGGGSTLIVTPTDESVLIDSGNPGARDSKRIHHVATEAAVTTHFHIDHFGGAAELSQLISIGAIFDNGIPEHNPDGGDDAWFFERIKP